MQRQRSRITLAMPIAAMDAGAGIALKLVRTKRDTAEAEFVDAATEEVSWATVPAAAEGHARVSGIVAKTGANRSVCLRACR